MVSSTAETVMRVDIDVRLHAFFCEKLVFSVISLTFASHSISAALFGNFGGR